MGLRGDRDLIIASRQPDRQIQKKFYSRGFAMRQTALAATLLIFMMFLGFGSAHADYTYTTIDVPGALSGTTWA